jgi:hypothetical protein
MGQTRVRYNRSYRLYFLDREDHIARAHDIESPSDEDVRELAAKMWSEQKWGDLPRYSGVEIWERGRKVWRHP